MIIERKLLTILCFFSLFVGPSSLGSPGQELKSDLNPQRWLTYYYLNPQPNLTAEAILAMSKQGYFDKPTAQVALAAFFSQVFAQNPNSIQSWFLRLDDLSERHKRTLWMALLYSATPQGKQQLKIEAEKAISTAKDEILKLLRTEPPSIAKLEITSPSVLDMLWGSFLATGDELYVTRIISTLAWVNDKDDTRKLLIGGAARWSLTSNCIQHKRVLEICKAQMAKQPPEVCLVLREIIKEAETKTG